MHRLCVGIVGHTNTGKTSLIRTLLRNHQFGTVRNEFGTTRHVEAAELVIDQGHTLELRDTPGLEDSSALWLQLKTWIQQGHESRNCLQKCLESAKELPDFEQELKVIKQALQCQLLMYVIDCREPIFDKYLDELKTLQLAAVPILPVLNFLHEPQAQQNQWREKLAQLGLHAHVAFDTVAFDFTAEKRLYQKMQTLLENEFSLIQKLIDKRQSDWQSLQQTLCLRVAHLLLDVCKIRVNPSTDTARQEL